MNKKFLNIILIIILSIVLIGIILYLFLKPSEENDIPQISPEDQIREVIDQNSVGDNFQLTHISDKHARGTVERDNVTQDVYLINSSIGWKIYQILFDSISCEKATRAGFPPIMIADCLYQSPGAQSPSDVNSGDFSDGDSIQIIGFIDFGDDPSNNFTIVGEDGSSVQVNTGGNPLDDSVNDGDYVVVEVVVDEDDEGNDEFIVDDVDDIDDEEDEILYDIGNLPPGEIPDGYLENLLDRDFSDEEVKLISDY